ncbi:MAG: CocE/NonD family hydrolase, partial [Sphingomonadales bacterium]
MGSTLRSLLAGAALLAAACSSATNDPEPNLATPEPEAVAPSGPPVTMMHLQAKMRDGVRLDTSVWLPATSGNFPVVLIRTPYKTEFRNFEKRLLAEGYAVVEQHERGRYLSEGQMRMLGRADEDGWDTLDWITQQPWSNGRIGTYGCSSSAENQLKLASLNHPAHKAIVVGSSGVGIAEVGPHREQGNFWRGGAWQMGWVDYMFDAMYLDWPQLAPGLSDAERTQQTTNYKWPEENGIPVSAFDKARMHLPVINLAKEVGAKETEVPEYLARGPSGAKWAEDRVTDKDRIKVPG